MSVLLEKVATCVFLAILLVLPISFSFPGFAYATTCDFGSPVSGMCRGYLTTTGAQTWTKPSDWNNASNTIEAIGGGAGGSTATGGGGGAYAKAVNQTLSGSSFFYRVGSGGATSTDGGATVLCDSSAYCDPSIVWGPSLGNEFDLSDYTIRQVIDSSVHTGFGNNTRVTVTFQAGDSAEADIVNAYIGEASSTGQAYDFASAPVQLKFSGSNSATIAAGQSLTSDPATFTVQAGQNLVVSYYVSPIGYVAYGTPGGWTAYVNITDVNDAANLDTNPSNYSGMASYDLGIKTIADPDVLLTPVVLADRGYASGAGGFTGNSTGSTKYPGGAGGVGTGGGGTGGGGAAGPHGTGGDGGSGKYAGHLAGGGGGGNGGGTNGADGGASTGGNGGDNSGGTGHGTGGNPGTAGTDGGGGGGGNNNSSGIGRNGGKGGAGTEFDETHGSGGGGGGGGCGISCALNGNGADGGLYGGGGGAGGYDKVGTGAQGIIVITYTPSSPAAPTGRIIRLIGGVRFIGGVRLGGMSPVP